MFFRAEMAQGSPAACTDVGGGVDNGNVGVPGDWMNIQRICVSYEAEESTRSKNVHKPNQGVRGQELA